MFFFYYLILHYSIIWQGILVCEIVLLKSSIKMLLDKLCSPHSYTAHGVSSGFSVAQLWLVYTSLVHVLTTSNVYDVSVQPHLCVRLYREELANFINHKNELWKRAKGLRILVSCVRASDEKQSGDMIIQSF